jgi:acyl carrier protein
VVAASGERRARQIADWERTRPFDLATEQPVRVTLITVDADLHLMVVNIHHIACDGVSYQRLATELDTFYTDHTAQLPDVAVQYADFASWELAGRTNGRLQGHFDHWRRTLADVDEQPLPLDRPHPDRPDPRGGSVEVAIKPETVDGIRALAAEYRASPYMLMLAAYHAVLAHLSQSADVSVGMPVSARSVPVLDDMVGYMVNTVVVRSHHTAGNTFADLLTQVRERFLDAMDHRAAPFKWVVDEVHPSRTAGNTNPLFQAGIDMDRIDDGAYRFAGLRVDLIRTPGPQAAKFDLTLHVVESVDERLFASLEYAAAVIDDETAQAWAASFETLLDAVVKTPDEPLARIYDTLRTPARRQAAAEAPVVEKANVDGVVERIHRAWCDVLDVDSVGLDDNFFDVNGDSLRAIALAGRLKEDGLDVTATDIFAYQTIEELVTLCAGRLDEPVRSAPVEPFALISAEDRAVMPLDVVDAYPLAAMQLGMLMEMRNRRDVNTYQDSTSYLVRDDGLFDADALQRAVQLVVNRHEVLRTTFDLNSYSVPLQLVHRDATITVGHGHYGTLGSDGWTPKLKEHAARERQTLMDLACAPLIRVFAHTADNAAEWWLTITECHPILEGWSFHTMLMEFLTVYREIRAGRTPAEPEPVGIRYADYIAAENAARRNDEDRAFWLDVVADRVDAVLPSAWQDSRDTPRDRYQHLIDVRDLDADLHRLATETRTSMKAVLLAAHLKVMSMVFGSDDFYTGVVCDARPEVAGAERVLGMYLNTLPFAMPADARTWGDLVTAVYDGLTAMWPHRVFPTQVIQQELGGGQRLLDVFFNYLDFHQVDSDLINEDVTLNDNDNEFALHVFTLPGLVKFNTTNHRLNREAARRLAGLYRTVLEEMSHGPDGDATAACIRSSVYTPQEPAHGTILEMVRGDADAPAVRSGLESLSYGQLDNLARAVAERLRACGVGPGSLVGVVPQRDVATPAAFLAAWMAGAAWTFVSPEGKYSAVVTATATGVPDVDVPVVVVRDDETAIWRPSAARATGPRPDDVAYVGTTGLVFSHRALASAVDSMRNAIQPGSSWLCVAPLPSAVTDLLVPLVSGGTVVITTSVLPDVVLEVKRLVETRAVTHLRVTPLVAERLGPLDAITVVNDGAIEIDGLPGLVAVAGEPLRDVGVRVVDARLRPVATGVVGELCLTGPRLADGFHADPAATADRFVPDPNGSRLYRTGRLARFTGDGRLEHLGPVEEHVRLNGHRVELYRVRELLATYPSITDSHVVVREVNGKDRLVAYVRTDAPLETDVVRRYLTDTRVSRRLIPDVVIPVESWPLTGTGTIDVDRLPEPSDDTTQEQAADEKPWDEQFETLVKETLASVNYTGELTPDVALTDLGLDSFTTVGLLVALEQAFDITIPDEIQIVDMFATARALWATVAALRMEVP